MILDLCSTLWSSHTSHLTNHITRSSINKLEQFFPGAVFAGMVYSYAASGTNPWFPPTAMHPYSDPGHYGPWTSNPTASYQLPDPNFSRERTVHTIYFKIWDLDTPARTLYVEEINQNGFKRGSDPEHFFHKLTGDEHQSHQMSDYWRSHYGLPMQHGGTPFQPTWTSSVTTPTPTPIPAADQQLATLLFGPHAVTPPTSSASSGSAPSLTAQGAAATTNMPLEQLRQLAVTLRDLSSSGRTL